MSMFQTEVQEDGRDGEVEKGGERLQKVRREMGGRGRRENKGEDRETKREEGVRKGRNRRRGRLPCTSLFHINVKATHYNM